MKKFLYVLIFVIACCMSGVYAEESVDKAVVNLYNMGFIDSADNVSGNISNSEMITLYGRLTGSGETDDAKLAKKAIDAGYVSEFYMNVLERDSEALFETAVLASLRATGYDKFYTFKSNDKQSYIVTAKRVGLLSGVEGVIGKPISRKSMYRLVYNTLTVPMLINSSYTESIEGEINEIQSYNKSNYSLLNRNFDIFVYKAEFYSGDVVSNEIWGSVVESRDFGAPLQAGSNFAKILNEKLSVFDYIYTKGEVWMNSREVFSVVVDEDYQVVYSVIEETNGNSNTSAKFSPNGIKSIRLINEEPTLKVSSTCSVYYNGNQISSGAYAFNKRFARLTVYNNEVIALYAYDVREGGLVETVTKDKIGFVRGSHNIEMPIKSTLQKKIVISKSGVFDYNYLKEDMVFDYYQADDYTLFVVGDKEVTGEFSKYSNKTITIDDIAYEYGDVFALYGTDGSYYKNISSAYKTLINCQVRAIKDFSGELRYIEYEEGDLERKNGFWAFAIAYKEGEVFENDRIVLVTYKDNAINVDPQIFEVSPKVKIDPEDIGTLTLDYVKNQAKMVYGGSGTLNENLKNSDNLFKFFLNSKNEIIKIGKVDFFDGHSNGSVKITQFPWYGKYYMGSPRVYYDNAPISALYFDELGKLKTETFKHTSFNQETCSELYVNFYCENNISEVDLMLIKGDVESIGSSVARYGLVYDQETMIENDNLYNLYRVYYKGEDIEVKVLADSSISVPAQGIISYRSPKSTSKNAVLTGTICDLSTDPQSWSIGTDVGDFSDGLYLGTVERINQRKIYFTNGSSYYIDKNSIFSVSRPKGVNAFEKQTSALISPGSSVWYFVEDEEVKYIFYQ